MIPIEPCPPLVLSPFVLIGPNKKKEKSQNIPSAAFTRTPLPPTPRDKHKYAKFLSKKSEEENSTVQKVGQRGFM